MSTPSSSSSSSSPSPPPSLFFTRPTPPSSPSTPPSAPPLLPSLFSPSTLSPPTVVLSFSAGGSGSGSGSAGGSGGAQVVNGTKNSIVVLENPEDDEIVVDGLDSYVAILSRTGVLAVIPEIVSQNLKALKEKTDKTTEDVVVTGDAGDKLGSYSVTRNAGRVCLYNPDGLDVNLTQKAGGKGYKAVVKRK